MGILGWGKLTFKPNELLYLGQQVLRLVRAAK